MLIHFPDYIETFQLKMSIMWSFFVLHFTFVENHVFFIADKENHIAIRGFEKSLKIISEITKTSNYTKIIFDQNDPSEIMNKICKEYENILNTNEDIFLLDVTTEDPSSKAIKFFSAALSIPTITFSYGGTEKFRLWEKLEESQKKYLIHIKPPAFLIVNLLEVIISMKNFTNIGIFYDYTFSMKNEFSSLLKKYGIRNQVKLIDENIVKSLSEMMFLNIFVHFVFASSDNANSFLEIYRDNFSEEENISLYLVSQDYEGIDCRNCNNIEFTSIRPIKSINDAEESIGNDFFKTTVVHALLALNKFSNENIEKRRKNFITCNEFNGTNTPLRSNFNFLQSFLTAEYENPLLIFKQNEVITNFSMKLNSYSIHNGKLNITPIGIWNSNSLTINFQDRQLFHSQNENSVFRILVVEQKPFIFADETHPKGFNGYCIDMMEKISEILKINYTFELATNNIFGEIDDNGNWNGLIKDVMDYRADIGLGSVPFTAARENVIDFTVPFYEPVGIVVLTKLFHPETSLNKFLDVLETDVWFCILAAFLVTSFLIWFYDRYSPKSYRNRRFDHGETTGRIFTLKESFWFVFTSMTPQGGGEVPENTSGRIVVGAWWFFSFIVLASYSANLAAILTVSMLDDPVENFDDVQKQFKMKYAPLNGSSTMDYFEKMARIEDIFHKVWKDMTLRTDLTEIERTKLSVWSFPVPDKYKNIWASMKRNGMPQTLEEAVERIRTSVTSTNGFAFIGDATDCRYLELTSCNLKIIGEEFSKKPFALIVPQGSPLKKRLDSAILQLINQGKLQKLKVKWWDNNVNAVRCEMPEFLYDGIGIKNMGGIFLTLIFGIILAISIISIEYFWFNYQGIERNQAKRVTEEVISSHTDTINTISDCE